MNNQTNFSLVERVKGHGPAIDQDELIDLLGELDAWRSAVSDYHVDGPEECAALVAELDANQENPDHADYDDLKSFFDDCVNALEDESGRWPCAEAYDLNLRQVICEAIHNGSECEE